MAGVPQVYLLGTKPCVEQCLDGILLQETNSRKCTDVWTSFKGIKFRSDEDVRMQKLKDYDSDTGSDMECQDLDLCDSSGSSNTDGGKKNKRDLLMPASPRMKRLKPSFNSCRGATSGHELKTVQPDETEVLGDVHAIVIDDETGLNRKIVPFIFQFFLWPCLILLAINNESSADLYGNFLKELGFYAQLRQEEISEVLVVYVPSQDAVSSTTKIRDSIQYGIVDNYFGKWFYSCQIDELVNEVRKELSKIGKQPQVTISGRKCLQDNGSVFENKPDDIVNKFLEALRKMDRNMVCKFFDLFTNIHETDLRKDFTDAFEDYGFIEREEEEDICYILPFILSETSQSCDERENKSEINDVIRLTVKCEAIPASLKVEILMTLQKNKWKIKSHGPNNFKSDVSYLCSLNRHDIVIELKSKGKLSYIYIYLLKFDEQCNCEVENEREYFETLRKNIEAALERFEKRLSTNRDLMCITERHILEKKNWIKEDLMSFNQLHPWFTSKEMDIEEKRNRELSDIFFTDISELFGKDFELFFVWLGIPHNRVECIVRENRDASRDAVFKLLLEWRKLEGPRASISLLRSKIKETNILTVDINRFNDVAKKHEMN